MSFKSPWLLLGLLVLALAIGLWLLADRRRARYAVRYTNLDVYTGDGEPDPAVRPQNAEPGDALSLGLESVLKDQNDEAVAAAKAAGNTNVNYTVHKGSHNWEFWRPDLKSAIAKGLFRPAPAQPANWTYKTAASEGQVWDIYFTYSPAPTAVTPSETETAAAEEQWPWMHRRPVRLASTRNATQAEAPPAAPSVAKPRPRPVVMAAQAQWPWLRRRARTVAQAQAPAPATPVVVKAKPKPVVRESQEQWPWMQRRPVVVVATRTAGY